MKSKAGAVGVSPTRCCGALACFLSASNQPPDWTEAPCVLSLLCTRLGCGRVFGHHVWLYWSGLNTTSYDGHTHTNIWAWNITYQTAYAAYNSITFTTYRNASIKVNSWVKVNGNKYIWFLIKIFYCKKQHNLYSNYRYGGNGQSFFLRVVRTYRHMRAHFNAHRYHESSHIPLLLTDIGYYWWYE